MIEPDDEPIVYETGGNCYKLQATGILIQDRFAKADDDLMHFFRNLETLEKGLHSKK